MDKPDDNFVRAVELFDELNASLLRAQILFGADEYESCAACLEEAEESLTLLWQLVKPDAAEVQFTPEQRCKVVSLDSKRRWRNGKAE